MVETQMEKGHLLRFDLCHKSLIKGIHILLASNTKILVSMHFIQKFSDLSPVVTFPKILMYLGIRLLCHYNFRWPVCRWVWFIFVLLCFLLPSLYRTLVFRYNACKCTIIQTDVNITSWSQTQKIYDSLEQGCTKPDSQVVMATKFCMVMPNTCGCSAWNLLHISLLVPTNLRWLLDFWKICAPLHSEVSILSFTHKIKKWSPTINGYFCQEELS